MGRRLLVLTGILSLILSGVSLVCGEEWEVVEEFEDAFSYDFLQATYKQGNITLSLSSSDEQVKSGTFSGRIDYEIDYSEETELGIHGGIMINRPLEGEPNRVRVWVCGDGQDNFMLILWVKDAKGDRFDYRGCRVDWQGWKEVVWDLSRPYGPLTGKRKKPDYPISINRFVFSTSKLQESKGSIYIDSLACYRMEKKTQVEGWNIAYDFEGYPFSWPCKHKWGEPGGGELSAESSLSDEEAHTGKLSWKLSYSHNPGEGKLGQGYFGFTPSLTLPGQPKEMSLWIYGKGKGESVTIEIRDSKGERFSYKYSPVLWKGWREQIITLSTPSWHTGGDNNGILDYPVELSSFLTTTLMLKGPIEGNLYVDDITCK